MRIRIALGILLFAGVFYLPWWFVAIVALLIVARYPGFEVVVAGALMDLLYGVALPSYIYYPYLFLTASVLLCLGAEFVKRRLIEPYVSL